MNQLSLFEDAQEPIEDEWSDDGLPEEWIPPGLASLLAKPEHERRQELEGRFDSEKETGPRFVAFDLEIAAAVRGNDWKAQRPLGISCAATLASDGELLAWYNMDNTPNEPRKDRMNPQEVQELAGYLNEMQARGYIIVTWNGASFDFDILAEECHNELWARDVAKLAWTHVDPGFQMVSEKGYMIGLETAGQGLGVGAKTEGMHGDLAPILWCGWPEWADDELRARIEALGVEPGTRAAQDLCLEYVSQDAKLTADVYRAILEKGFVPWISRSGRYNTWWPNMRHDRMMTVMEAMELPDVDTSWMTNPRSRESYLEWMRQ